MRLNFLNTSKLLAFALLLLTFGSCSKEVDMSGGNGTGTPTDDKVKLELFAKIPDYTPPTTRTGSAQENAIDMTPWVLVFKGTGDNATYVEAAQAINMAGQRFVTLTKQSSDGQLLILANPQPKFTTPGNATEYDFSIAHFDALLKPGGTPKTLSEACQLLLTQALASPQATVPFASTADPKPRIPMSFLHPVSEIAEDTKISGPSGTPLEMERVVAKVIVENAAANFTLKGATVIHAPRQGQLHRLSTTLKSNSGTVTEYMAPSGDPVEGIAAAIAGTLPVLQTTTPNPIYLYESRTEENTCVIIKGTYEGVDNYYKLSFLSTDGSVMNVQRNYEYTFHIASVGRPGFTNLDDAITAQHPSNEDITWTITVSDQYSHDIVDNGEYYLGVTNSVYIAYGDGELNNMHAFTVTTDCTKTLTDNSITVSGTGLSLAAPANGKIPPATGATLSPCEVKLNMTSAFTSGTVSLRLGNLVKTVTIEKRPAIEGVIPFMQFSGDYLSAEIESGDWLSLSADGINEQGNYINTKDGTIYLMPEPNYGTTGTLKNDGVVYLSRQNNTAGRIKIDISQKVTSITAPSMPGLPYPYVGTFHRASEVGERLVRIPTGENNTGEWCARIVAGEDFIKLANGFRNGSVGWPYEDTNAESYPVEGDLQIIHGDITNATADIRFRVGMKSQLSTVNPDWNTAPRYGKILIAYADYTQCWEVYVRQGEAADYVMDKNDGSGNSTLNNRPLAMRYSPYNSTVPEFKNTANVTHTVAAPLRPATNTNNYFTAYPSQAGALYQWGPNYGPTKGRYAFNPAVPNDATTPMYWMPEYTSGVYWEPSFGSTVETCPNGYRRPKDITNNSVANNSGVISDSEMRQSLWYNPQTSINNDVENSIWGFYADGFFDRRLIDTQPAYNGSVSNTAVSINNSYVAYIGRLFYNPIAKSDHYNASIFFPAAGHRNYESGTSGFLCYTGNYGYYWSSSAYDTKSAWYMYLGRSLARTSNPIRSYGFSVRCVKE